ncbi:MAG: hydroxyacid dehydrogenase [Pirellulaceae bacterium]|nr:hydroxyacid dehydrogenase [Pirellulaceae bacterium]HJN12922.1 hydroxyacid dehydrogenase [Pirellulaceae bacterium]
MSSNMLVSENITGPAMDALRSDFDVTFAPELWSDVNRLKSSIGDARALIVRNQTQVTAELINAAPKLEVIGRAGAGLDNIDTDAATEAGIVVTYAPQENSISVAELTIGLILALARRIPAAHFDTSGGGWNRKAFTGSELFGKTLGVIGLGRIGTLVAQRAKAFDMPIIAHDDYVDPNSDHVRALDIQLLSLDEVLREADIVVTHVPLTEETRSMFSDARFGLMKPTAMFVNTSRGEVVDERALVKALRDKQIAGAALDVRNSEPPDQGPLNELDNVILTPHIAAFTREAQDRVVAAVCRDVAAVIAGGEAANHFNFPTPRRKNS